MKNTAVSVREIGARNVVGADAQGMRRVGLVRPASNPVEILEAHKSIADMVSKVLERDVDYGEIPGTAGTDGKNKLALLKPGAERLAFSIGASIELEVIEQEIDHHVQFEWSKRQKEWYTDKGKRKYKWVESSGTARGVYRYVVKARLVRREDGAILGEGVGSCSTMESKYVDRPRDMENTVLKMAKKRAAVDAVLSTMALSGRFAPDDVPEADGVVEDPTDGLTLNEALAFDLNGTTLGSMRPKALLKAREYCENKLEHDPDSPSLLRLAAMIEMVTAFRKESPLPAAEPKAEAAKVEPAKAETTAAASTTDSPVVDDDDPFA